MVEFILNTGSDGLLCVLMKYVMQGLTNLIDPIVSGNKNLLWDKKISSSKLPKRQLENYHIYGNSGILVGLSQKISDFTDQAAVRSY